MFFTESFVHQLTSLVIQILQISLKSIYSSFKYITLNKDTYDIPTQRGEHTITIVK